MRAFRRLLGPVVASLSEYALFGWLWFTARKPSKQEVLVWTPEPILNNKHWSAAMTAAGQKSVTLMQGYGSAISTRHDFDLYFHEFVPKTIPFRYLRARLAPYFAERWILRHASIVHIPFTGGPLCGTRFCHREAQLLRRAGVRVIVIPYGGDAYTYSSLIPIQRHAHLVSYPTGWHDDSRRRDRVSYWSAEADFIVTGFVTEGLPRWDATPHNMLAVDSADRAPDTPKSAHDGKSGPVVVLHTSNHAAIKGSEFIRRGVEELTSEGLDVELRVLEGVPNDKVRTEMREADILADQLIIAGYGLAAVEGMACGLPVIANLEDAPICRLMRLYGNLSECPIASAAPEAFTEVLRRLVTDPDLRQQIGVASRAFAERYHSYASAARFFGAIHRKLLAGDEVDLMRMFDAPTAVHPTSPPIPNPLLGNRLPPVDVAATQRDDAATAPAERHTNV